MEARLWDRNQKLTSRHQKVFIQRRSTIYFYDEVIFDHSKTGTRFQGQIPSYAYSYDLLLTNVRCFESFAYPSGQGSLDSSLRNGAFQGFLQRSFFYGTEQQDHKEQIMSLFVPFVTYLPVKYRKHSKSAKTFIETNL